MAQSLSGFALLNIHMEWLFEWAVEILTEPSAENPCQSGKGLNITKPMEAQLLETRYPKSGECR